MAPKEAPVYTRRGKSKSVAPSHRVIHDSSGEEYTPGKRRAPPPPPPPPPHTAPFTTRHRNRQTVISDEEHPSSTTPIVSPQSEEGAQHAEESYYSSESQSNSSSTFTPASTSDATRSRQAHVPMGIPMYPVMLNAEPNMWCVEG
ncbi:hypothetical protein KY290_025090 [Solanum tuberosum]|uniref:Integrase core domain containing protein n=1 Tax=Solanum tuberosum TaxID=4113 RepID=A0ABQ7USM3_SOLTU|nr:hypothetical protein KY290_025090 [Solanum tuberosum]